MRALLPIQEANCSFEELIEKMAQLSKIKLMEKKFGKRRIETPTLECSESATADPAPEWKRTRSISQETKFHIWQRDQAQCQNCGSQRALEIDHIYSFARGGGNEPKNLRLLCHQCNQRQRIKKFGFAVAQK